MLYFSPSNLLSSSVVVILTLVNYYLQIFCCNASKDVNRRPWSERNYVFAVTSYGVPFLDKKICHFFINLLPTENCSCLTNIIFEFLVLSVFYSSSHTLIHTTYTPICFSPKNNIVNRSRTFSSIPTTSLQFQLLLHNSIKQKMNTTLLLKYFRRIIFKLKLCTIWHP